MTASPFTAGRSQPARVGISPGADALQQYLRELARYPLLTADEEVALAKAIEAGDHARELLATVEGSCPVTRRDELIRTVETGRAAKQRFIESNLRLAYSIAKGYRNRGLPFLDLIQEANLGLMRGVDKFDHRRGFKFSTYGTWWIRQSVSRAIANSARTIRLPVHFHEVVGRVRTALDGLHERLGREPGVEDIAQAAGMAPELVSQVLGIAREPLSLHQLVGDGGAELGDYVRDDQLPDPFDAAVLNLMCEAAQKILAPLTEREREVVVLRFGLRGGLPQTLEEVGVHFALTRERIRQIESRALCKLRHPANRPALEALPV